MTADPNDSKGPQQIPATDVYKILHEVSVTTIAPGEDSKIPAVTANMLSALAKIVEDAAGHRGKGRPAELSDIPPASLRHMASLMKVYARQLAMTMVSPATVAAAVEAEAQAVVDAALHSPTATETVAAVVVDTQAEVTVAVPFTVEVMAEVGPFGPPGAYPDNADEEPVPDQMYLAFGPPARYVESDDDNPPEVEAPKA